MVCSRLAAIVIACGWRMAALAHRRCDSEQGPPLALERLCDGERG